MNPYRDDLPDDDPAPETQEEMTSGTSWQELQESLLRELEREGI